MPSLTFFEISNSAHQNLHITYYSINIQIIQRKFCSYIYHSKFKKKKIEKAVYREEIIQWVCQIH